jgi:GTP-binding protein
MPVSALHGHGTGDLLDRVVEHFPPQTEEEEEDDGAIRVAIIGKPNTGKSSLLNHLTGEMRSIVSNMPGTTRDSVDALVENEYGRFLMVDTAGLRRKARVDEAVEKYSVLRALMAIERAHVCVIMIDAEEGVTEQDTKVAGYAHEKGKASVLAINKWDLIEKETDTMRKYEEKVQEAFAYMSYAPIVFISAKTGARVPTLLKAITDGYEQYNRRITTGALNDVLNDATERVQPPTDRGKRLKIYYITQVSVAPPTFVLFVNETALFHYSYKRYIENQLRAVFGFAGTPIRLIVREKDEGNDPSTFAR